MASRVLPAPSAGRNRAFAKRARGFVNWALALPGMPLLPAAGFAAIVVASVTGPFHTGGMPPAQRTALWALLIGWNVLKWQGWFAWRARSPGDWPRAAAIGAVLLNLPLPIEVAIALRLFGLTGAPGLIGVWLQALAISAALFAVIGMVARRRGASASPPVPEVVPGGLLDRAGLAGPCELHAVRAEDHYCRLFLADGRSPLIHYRFGDALAELAGLPGGRVHRGAWAAQGAIRGAERDGRRWLLRLADGTRLPVSQPYVAEARTRGWLRPARPSQAAGPAPGGPLESAQANRPSERAGRMREERPNEQPADPEGPSH